MSTIVALAGLQDVAALQNLGFKTYLNEAEAEGRKLFNQADAEGHVLYKRAEVEAPILAKQADLEGHKLYKQAEGLAMSADEKAHALAA